MFHKVFEYFRNCNTESLSVYLFEVHSVVGFWDWSFFFLFSVEFRVKVLHVIGKLLLNTPINGSEICDEEVYNASCKFCCCLPVHVFRRKRTGKPYWT